MLEQPILPWIEEGRKFIGIHEVRNRDVVNSFWKDTVSPYNYEHLFKDKNHSWCSAYVGSMLKRSGVDIKDTTSKRPIESSQYWLGTGVLMEEPEFGCIVVFDWGGGKGHVGFCTGKTKTGSLIILGGNQNDAVNEKAFLLGKVAGYVWPEGTPYLPEKPLPIRDMSVEHVRT